MTKLLLLPITLPLRIVRVTAETSFEVARGVLDILRPRDERPFADDDVFFASPSPPSPPPAPPEPEPEHLDLEDDLVAESGPAREPGAEIHVEAPWAGYDAMALDEVLARLQDASEAEVAIVRLYERQHENRQAVLLATGEDP